MKRIVFVLIHSNIITGRHGLGHGLGNFVSLSGTKI
jgi:hypothetical protein